MLQGLPADIVAEALESESFPEPSEQLLTFTSIEPELQPIIEEGEVIIEDNIQPATLQVLPLGPSLNETRTDFTLTASAADIETFYTEAVVQQTIEEIEISKAQNIAPSQLRYSDASWFHAATDYVARGYSIVLIGAGGIGSWVGVILAKMGFKLTIFDADSYSEENIAGQLFKLNKINHNKAAALAILCRQFTQNTAQLSYNENFTSEWNLASPIVISAVDNMESRLVTFLKWLSTYGDNLSGLFIDGRLAAETYQVYTIKGRDYRAQIQYLLEWFPDSQGDAESCSFKQTSYMAAGIGHQICMNVASFFSRWGADNALERPLPYLVEATPYYRVEEMYANKPLSNELQALIKAKENGEYTLLGWLNQLRQYISHIDKSEYYES